MLSKLAAAFLLFCALLPSQTSFEQLAESATQARQTNQVPKAIELYRSALRIKPDWPEGLFFLGSLLYDSDQFSAAESVLGRFVEITPQAGPALALLGLCEFETGHYADSLKHIQQAPPQDGQMGAVLRFHEAQLLTKTGSYEKALQLFAGFLHGSEAPSAVLVPLGIAALHQPLIEKQVPPAQHDFYLAAGQTGAAILSGDADRSQALLSDLLTRFPNTPGVHYLHGFYLLAQDPALAQQEFRRELAIDGSNASANVMLAWMLLNHREVVAALPYAKKALAETPDDQMAEYVYGRTLAESSDVRKGITYLEKALKADPQNLETHLALTSAYSKSGRTEDARTERQRCLQLAREVAPVIVH